MQWHLKAVVERKLAVLQHFAQESHLGVGKDLAEELVLEAVQVLEPRLAEEQVFALGSAGQGLEEVLELGSEGKGLEEEQALELHLGEVGQEVQEEEEVHLEVEGEHREEVGSTQGLA